jgi:hypothetical protein
VQQFTVPQFIDVEDKIIGPITSRQFVILLGASLLIAINYKIFDFSLFLVVSAIELVLAIIFSFVKVNGRPFHFFVLNLIQTFKRSNLRIWINGTSTIEAMEKEIEAGGQSLMPVTAEALPYKTSRLEELSLIVDTQGAYKGEDNK